MKRRYHLKDKDRFQEVRQTGASFAHPLLVLCRLPNGCAISRCGFTVSRRIGNAVERNRARRRMSEAMRLLWDLVEPGWDMVLIARPGINAADFVQVQTACAHLLRRAGLLRTPPLQPEARSDEPNTVTSERAAIAQQAGAEIKGNAP